MCKHSARILFFVLILLNFLIVEEYNNSKLSTDQNYTPRLKNCLSKLTTNNTTMYIYACRTIRYVFDMHVYQSCVLRLHTHYRFRKVLTRLLLEYLSHNINYIQRVFISQVIIIKFCCYDCLRKAAALNRSRRSCYACFKLLRK